MIRGNRDTTQQAFENIIERICYPRLEATATDFLARTEALSQKFDNVEVPSTESNDQATELFKEYLDLVRMEPIVLPVPIDFQR